MLRLLFDIGCSLDWITPTIALVKDAVNGPHYTFSVPEDECRIVKRTLRRKGIKSWGRIIVPNFTGNANFIFTVRQNQAPFAEHVLRQAGVNILNPLGR